MGVESRWKSVAPDVAPVSSVDRDESLGHFEKSVDAVSFGFVATAILIAMFVVMAIFEKFLRPRSAGRNLGDLEAQMTAGGKLNYPSPKVLSLPPSIPPSLSLYIYTYIYVYFCVCLCISRGFEILLLSFYGNSFG